jgi:hypothetical protein
MKENRRLKTPSCFLSGARKSAGQEPLGRASKIAESVNTALPAIREA